MSSDRVIKSGYIEKQGSYKLSWHKRFWVLTPDELNYYTDEHSPLKGTILIRDILTVSVSENFTVKQNALQILLTNKRNYWLSFDDRESALDWKQAIEEAKKAYIARNTNYLLLGRSSSNSNEVINPKISYILQQIEKVQDRKELMHLLRDLEKIIMDLPQNVIISQHEFVEDIINKLRKDRPEFFDFDMDNYVNSILENFYVSSSSDDDDDDDNNNDDESLREFSSPPFINITQLYKFKAKLGEGTYSIVMKAKDRSTNEEVAVKIVSKKKLNQEDQLSLFREVTIMNRLKRHPNVISLKGFFQDNDYYYIVQEIAEGGELFDAIVRRSNYSEREAQKLVRTLVATISYCHQRGIVHRDLKPENILLASKYDDLRIKLADFGFARNSHFSNNLSTSCGTPGYLAPEILRGQKYGSAVDMWSIGVITYILLCGYPPFPTDNDALLYRRTIRGEYQFHSPEWDNISDDAKEFVRRLMVVDPDARYTAPQASNMRWMRFESTSTMHMDGAIRMLENYNMKRKNKQQDIDVEMTNIPSSSLEPQKQSPVTNEIRYLTIYPAELRLAPSLNCNIQDVIQPGTILVADQVVYTVDGTWLRITPECIASIHVHKATTPDYQPPYQLKWICAEARSMDPLCIPVDSMLFESLWEKNTALHNVRNGPTINSDHVGRLPSGQRFIATEMTQNAEGTRREWMGMCCSQ
ncbi:hypothetical protein WA158_005082 [Blastocystis sp. Blastoise]